jgi:hypothetical protein
MDIHKPKHPIHSLREFLAEIFTVTCGIVIALGLESLIVAHDHHLLRESARTAFRVEIAANQARLQTLVQTAPADEAMIAGLIQYGSARLAHGPATLPAGASTGRTFAFLPNTAWQTALATQAIGQLPFAEVRALSTLSDGQQVFDDFQTRARDQWVGIAAYGDIAQLSDDDVRHALQELRIAYAYKISITALAQDLLTKSEAAQRTLGPAK